MKLLNKIAYLFKDNRNPSIEICFGDSSAESLNFLAEACENVARALRETKEKS